jgi:sensor histidine kinase YesM
MKQFWRRLPKYHSIRGRLSYYSVLLFAFIIPMILTSTVMGGHFLRLPEVFSQRSDQLNRFYESVQVMDSHARSYLYQRAESELTAFNEVYDQTAADLETLKLSLTGLNNADLPWRISLLDNMIQTYRETFRKLADRTLSAEKYSVAYDFMVSTAENIDRTRNQYNRLLTDEMTFTVSQMKSSWKTLQIATYGILLALLVAAALFSASITRSITQPLQKLMKNIQKIKAGRYDLKEIKTNHYEEIDVLCDAFADMAASLDGYIGSLEQNVSLENRLLEKENENLRISELLTKTELQALQAQMNPHFLFNTLSMLSKLAYIDGAYQTSEMMDAVADLMRYSLEKSSKASDLQGEIACLRNYIAIQRKRFGSRIAFHIAVDHTVSNVIMPGMVLQPLVENAIIHGVAQMPKGAMIDVNIYHDSKLIYVEISDNGVGMEQQCIDLILSGQDPSASLRHSSIGFQNVLRRLKLFFGANYQVLLHSEPGCGTAVILTLPHIVQKEPENV